MKLSRLVIREIRHRKGSFALGVIAVAFAVVAFAGSLALLDGFDKDTEKQAAELAAETQKLLKSHEDDIRKAMKGLGFNIHIYPESQDLGEIYAKGHGSETMPEEYVRRLAESKIVTVNHLLPRLARMVEWRERKRTVLMLGVSGQVPIAHRGPTNKKPLMNPVAPGSIVLGYELHRDGGLNIGDTVGFQGSDFKVAGLHARRGSIDDITVWIPLASAQEMLDLPGRIDSILALECNCATLDRLGEIEKELMAILPGIQIVEVESKALARAVARNKAKALRQQEEKDHARGRTAQRETRASMIEVLVPLVALLSMAWIAYLTFVNVGHRMQEIGTLRAIGVRSGTVLGAFLMRALLMGLAGSLLALIACLAAGIAPQLKPSGWAAVLAGVPMLAAAAAWLPSLLASERDPAVVLRHD